MSYFATDECRPKYLVDEIGGKDIVKCRTSILWAVANNVTRSILYLKMPTVIFSVDYRVSEIIMLI